MGALLSLSLQGVEHEELVVLSQVIEQVDAFDVRNCEEFNLDGVQDQSRILEGAIYKAGNPENLSSMVSAVLNSPTIFVLCSFTPCFPSKLAAVRFHTNLTAAKELRTRLQEEANG